MRVCQYELIPPGGNLGNANVDAVARLGPELARCRHEGAELELLEQDAVSQSGSLEYQAQDPVTGCGFQCNQGPVSLRHCAPR